MKTTTYRAYQCTILIRFNTETRDVSYKVKHAGECLAADTCPTWDAAQTEAENAAYENLLSLTPYKETSK